MNSNVSARWMVLALASVSSSAALAQMRRPGPPEPPDRARPTPTAVEFCSRPDNALRTTPYPSHARNRMARVALDAGCARHPTIRCTRSSPVRPEAQRPTACVDIELVQGASNAVYSGPGASPLACVQCEDDRLPTERAARCDDATLADARRQRVVMNISGAKLEAIEALYADAMRTRAARLAEATDAVRRDPVALRRHLDLRMGDWGYRLEAIVQQLAPQLGYCERAPFGMPEDNRGWRYADRAHRVALESNITFQGEGEFGATTMGTLSAAFGPQSLSRLVMTLTAFYAPARPGQPAEPTRLDIDGLALALIHEMRHMATPQFGMGDSNNERVSNAERFLNELEDYTRMFEHPYVIGLDATRIAALRGEYGAGRNTMYGCFANLWGSAGPAGFPGYPDDSQQQAGAALGMLMPGFGGLTLPIFGGAGGRAGINIRVVWPHVLDRSNWNPAGFLPQQCTTSGLTLTAGAIAPLSAAQRCEVARWARNDPWMASKMSRSLFQSEEHQPWNTLAHHVLALPFRARVYEACASAP